jgi:hypothetical protein
MGLTYFVAGVLYHHARLQISERHIGRPHSNIIPTRYLIETVIFACLWIHLEQFKFRKQRATDDNKLHKFILSCFHYWKAGQSLTRNETKDERLWKEIGEEVRKDTDKLFKMIGEAYAVLSDPAKVKISSPITILSSVFVFS